MEQYHLKENLLNDYMLSNGEYKSYNKLMAQYINISEKLRREITMKKNPFIMLDKSLLCIALMTGDKAFYTQNRNNLIEIMQNWNYYCIIKLYK